MPWSNHDLLLELNVYQHSYRKTEKKINNKASENNYSHKGIVTSAYKNA